VEIKTFQQIYTDMINHSIARQDRLTDFNDGSVLCSQFEAFAREIAMAYVACRVGYRSHLRSLPMSVFGFDMLGGERAGARVVFSRSKPFSHETMIPAGTLVSGGGMIFATSAAVTIPSGATASPPVPAIAERVGEEGNVGAGEIGAIVSILPEDVTGVSNQEPAAGGKSAEDWAAYMDRFGDYILGLQRTNASGFLSGLRGSGLTRSIGMVEHFPPLEGIWNMTLYLEDGSGAMKDEDMERARLLMEGYRSPGVLIRYLPPDMVGVSIKAVVSADRDAASAVDSAFIATQAAQALRDFVNARRIGEPVLRSDLIVELRRLPILSNAAVIEPAADVAIEPHQIARCASVEVETAE